MCWDTDGGFLILNESSFSWPNKVDSAPIRILSITVLYSSYVGTDFAVCPPDAASLFDDCNYPKVRVLRRTAVPSCNQQILLRIQSILRAFQKLHHIAMLCQSFVIDGVTSDNISLQDLIFPLRLPAPGYYTITNGNDGIEIIIFDISLYRAFTLYLNCR